MRCCRGRWRLLGRAAVALGALILLALVMPGWFWWLVCGVLLVIGGCLLSGR